MPSRRGATLALLSLPVAWISLAAQVQEIRWDELQRKGSLPAGSVVPPLAGASFSSLKIEGTEAGNPVTVAVIERPAIKGPRYAVTGQVRYEGVEGTGYLELWNHFPNGGRFFSRTLGDAGPMQKLQGSAGWRQFSLPFDATGGTAPTRLVVNVVLPGSGVVYLGPLELVDGVAGAAGRAGWPVDRAGGLIGGVGGSIVGLVGALIGVLASLGRGRRFVTIASNALVIGGTLAFGAGVVALSRSQPYAVYYPLLLIGFLATVIPLGLRASIRRRYEEIELRRMRAHDLA